MNNTSECVFCVFFYQKHSPKVNFYEISPMLIYWPWWLCWTWGSLLQSNERAVSCLLCFALLMPYTIAYHYYLFHPVPDDDIWGWLLWSYDPFLSVYENYTKKKLQRQAIIEKTTTSSQRRSSCWCCNHSCRFFTYHTHNGRAREEDDVCLILVILWIFNQEYGFSMVWIDLIKRF